MRGAPLLGFSLGLAFYKVNDRPLIHAIEHAANFYLGPKLYLWKQRVAEENKAVAATPVSPEAVPRLSESKLKDLAWSLNIKDRKAMGVANAVPTGFEL